MGSLSTYSVIIPMAHSASVITYSDEYCTIPEYRFDAPVPETLVAQVRKDIALPCFITGPVTGVITTKAYHNLVYIHCKASDGDLVRMRSCFLSNHPEVPSDELVIRRCEGLDRVIIYNFSAFHFSLWDCIKGLEGTDFSYEMFGYTSHARI